MMLKFTLKLQVIYDKINSSSFLIFYEKKYYIGIKNEFISFNSCSWSSKEIFRKNIKLLNGKPLIKWTIDTAKNLNL